MCVISSADAVDQLSIVLSNRLFKLDSLLIVSDVYHHTTPGSKSFSIVGRVAVKNRNVIIRGTPTTGGASGEMYGGRTIVGSQSYEDSNGKRTWHKGTYLKM